MLIDTYAWVEYFKGNEKGEKVKKLLMTKLPFTSIVTLAEITGWCLKNNLEVEKYLKTIKDTSVILNLDIDIVELAGKTNFERKNINKIKNWGMIDSLIISTARAYNLKLISGDQHFKKLDDVVYIGD